MTNIILFITLSIVSYICISTFGQMTGGAKNSVWEVLKTTLTPIPFLTITIANIIWGVAVYYGFKSISFTIPAALAIGVLTSFIFMVFVVGKTVTIYNLLGILFVIAGIYLLA